MLFFSTAVVEVVVVCLWLVYLHNDVDVLPRDDDPLLEVGQGGLGQVRYLPAAHLAAVAKSNHFSSCCPASEAPLHPTASEAR